MRKKRRLARALAPIVVRIYLNIESNLFPCIRGLIYYYAKPILFLLLLCRSPHSWSWSSILTHSLAKTSLGKALHHLSLQFVNTLNLLLAQELRILLVVFLTDVENLLAHLKTLLDFLFGLSIRFHFALLVMRART